MKPLSTLVGLIWAALTLGGGCYLLWKSGYPLEFVLGVGLVVCPVVFFLWAIAIREPFKVTFLNPAEAQAPKMEESEASAPDPVGEPAQEPAIDLNKVETVEMDLCSQRHSPELKKAKRKNHRVKKLKTKAEGSGG